MERRLLAGGLSRSPVLEALSDVEAAARCDALVGTLDAMLSLLVLARMTVRARAVPPFFSLVGGFCPLSRNGGAPSCRGLPWRGSPPSWGECERGAWD